MPSVEENLRKVPPQNLEAEESVLGGILLDNYACNLAVPLLRSSDFYRESHRRIFDAILDLHEHGSPVDTVTLTEALRQRGVLQDVGGATFIAELADRVPTAANVEYYARIVRDKAILRGLITTATEIATQAYESRGDVERFVDEAESKIFGIAEQKVRSDFHTVRELLPLSIKEVEKLFERKEMITGIPTGFHDLDRLTAGLQNGDLIIVAGRPGMGKTALALNMATNAALQTGLGVAIFSLEMSKEQLVLRMLCSEARVNYQDVRSGHLRERDFARLATAAGGLHQASIYIDDSAALSVLELRAKARRLRHEAAASGSGSGLGLIVVDYLQLMRGSGRTDSREQEISEISRSLKALAKDLAVPVVALSQLNRRVEEKGADRRPVMANLRESGAIEQDADLILFVYREAAYNKELAPEEERDAELIIGKQRNGPTGTVHATFLKEFMRFEDRALPSDEAYEHGGGFPARDYDAPEP
jgi:replicative DNA helicase